MLPTRDSFQLQKHMQTQSEGIQKKYSKQTETKRASNKIEFKSKTGIK